MVWPWLALEELSLDPEVFELPELPHAARTHAVKAQASRAIGDRRATGRDRGGTGQAFGWGISRA